MLVDDVETIIIDNPGLTAREIAEKLFGSDGYQERVDAACRRLIEQKRVRRHGEGHAGKPYRYHPVTR